MFVIRYSEALGLPCLFTFGLLSCVSCAGRASLFRQCIFLHVLSLCDDAKARAYLTVQAHPSEPNRVLEAVISHQGLRHKCDLLSRLLATLVLPAPTLYRAHLRRLAALAGAPLRVLFACVLHPRCILPTCVRRMAAWSGALFLPMVL
jgi:hypothetical protein